MITIEGVIEDIIFRNDENGYTVAILGTDQGSLTIVGSTPFINTEETVKLTGDMTYHNNYGEQFQFESLEIVIPTSLKGIENYLGSGLIPGIGPKTAKNIVKKFGADSLDIIQYSPDKLLKVKGIGKKTLKSIVESYEDQREIRDIMIFLQNYNISVAYGMKIYKKYGPDTKKVIEENPYKLSEDIYGIGFKRADEIAKNMGITGNNPNRIKAGLRYTLLEAIGEGHCYLPKGELIPKAREILEVSEEEILNNLQDMAMLDDIVLINRGEDADIYSKHLYQAENTVARKLVEIASCKLEDEKVDLDRKIQEIEDQEKIEFASEQIEAIKESIDNGLLVITGGPGTGKTTTINAIIKICEDMGLAVTLGAPTGRAAKRMAETTGREAKTIHRLLEYSFMEESAMAFGKDEDSPIEADLIIIDESSMIDILLMNSLLKAVSVGTRLILVGDIDQLPSVGAGNVLRDIIDSGEIKLVRLEHIFRQSEESMIIVNAHRINQGIYPILNKNNKDFYFIKKSQGQDILKTIIDLCSERLPSFYDLDKFSDIQVLSPMKKGDVGVNALNEELQKNLNPASKDKDEKQVGNTLYRVGDKVMQMKNNYNMEWTLIRAGIKIDKGEGIFNGDMGIITSIDEASKELVILFDEEKEVKYAFNQLDELALSYAITVHKSQGSEFPVVVMPISWGPPMLLMRNLLYTGITRAKQLVVLVGEERYLQNMIRNNKIASRYSNLNEKIVKSVELLKR